MIRRNFGVSHFSKPSARLNEAGTSTSVSRVESSRPPITTTAIGARQLASPSRLSAVGTMPATIAIVVITIGWARLWPASMIASFFGTPFAISSIVKSSSRIEFLATMPNSIRMPISTGIEIAWPAIHKRDQAAERGEQQRAHVHERRHQPLVEQHKHREDEEGARNQRRPELGHQLRLPRAAGPERARSTPSGRFCMIGSCGDDRLLVDHALRRDRRRRSPGAAD